ncbi:Gfo/Idh/MocA family oxidoreductase [Rhodocytophaga rosea]|uniref:Gfo/Idh/MocA family oxidoreductase n=1 Tax=Rhodocytophaga rosea TaxID=2704465 RepID=A0A6C0GST6_9BACT|nr:Gfo/Idh/MocA family oxidoreductase [Rhodocytophaga rosea]QHT71215.1 Gfo/Idh/MocA family oxidoreductase [Rhodocytophaga rosea]
MYQSIYSPSRRGFIKQASYSLGIAGIGGAAANPVFASQSLGMPSESVFPPEKKAGWAIVGLGKYATEQIMPAFAECKKSKLVALVSGTPDKAKKLADQYGVNSKNIYNYQNYDSIKNNPEVDIIYIILPNSLHAEYTIRGAQAGKHMISEKPMATSVKDAQAMIDACKKAGKKLMIGYRAQYEPFNLKVIEMVRSNALGQLKMITSDHGRILKPEEKADQWRMKKDLAGGGSLMDIGIYSLNAARYLTGEEPVEITAMMHSTPNDPRFKEVEENMTFLLRFPSGVIAQCNSSYSYQEVKRYRVFGSEAWLDLDPATDYYRHTLHIGKKESKEQILLKEGNQFASQLDHFSECVLENKEPKTPGEEGLQDLKLMMAIYEAAASKEKVKV